MGAGSLPVGATNDTLFGVVGRALPSATSRRMLQAPELIARIRAYQPTADVDVVARAYDYSVRAHEGQKRKSGDPYFIHPASVAGIITELRLDTASICAGLLHDVVEDTLRTLDDIERDFG